MSEAFKEELRTRMASLVIQHDQARKNMWITEGVLEEARAKFWKAEAQLNEVRAMLKALEKIPTVAKPMMRARGPLPKVNEGTNGKHSG